MMKRFLFLLAFIPGILSAQGTNDRTALVINGLDAVWSSSSNAAGLVLSPYSAFNVLDLRYAWQGGDGVSFEREAGFDQAGLSGHSQSLNAILCATGTLTGF